MSRLIMEGISFYLDNDVEVKTLRINKGCLVVAGNVTVSETVELRDAMLVVAGKLKIQKENGIMELVNSELSVGNCEVYEIHAQKTDIFVHDHLDCYKLRLTKTPVLAGSGKLGYVESKGGNIEIKDDLSGALIDSDSDIIIHGSTDITKVCCFTYLVDGNNNSFAVMAMQAIYILGDSDSLDLIAPEIFIGGDVKLDENSIYASRCYEVGGKS